MVHDFGVADKNRIGISGCRPREVSHLDNSVEPARHSSYFPPNRPSYELEDLARFRLILDTRGWCVGIIWSSHKLDESPSRAGVTWIHATKHLRKLWHHLADCDERLVDGADAYSSIVADSRGVAFSSEFQGTGAELEAARRWVTWISDDTSWARGVRLPDRTKTIRRPSCHQLETILLASDDAGERLGLLTCGPDEQSNGPIKTRLLRDEGAWWVVPEGGGGLRPSLAHPLNPAAVAVFDEYGCDLFAIRPLRRGLYAADTNPLWNHLPDGAPEANLQMAISDENEPRALVATASADTYVRGESRWFRLPVGSPILDGLIVTDVSEDMISVWDEFEQLKRLPELDYNIIDFFTVSDGPASCGQLFEAGAPIDFRTVDELKPGLLAAGPFVVEYPDHRFIGHSLRRVGDLVAWDDVDGRVHVIDSSSYVSLDDCTAHVSFHGENSHSQYSLRPIQLEDAQRRVPPGSA